MPDLSVSRARGSWWSTVPYPARDPAAADDFDARGPDHAADACRYALTAEKPSFCMALISGVYG